jgi:hypothetical protein
MNTAPSSIAPSTKSTTERTIFASLAAAYPQGTCLHRLRRSRHEFNAKGVLSVIYEEIDLEHPVARCRCQDEISGVALGDHLSGPPKTLLPAKRAQSRQS